MANRGYRRLCELIAQGDANALRRAALADAAAAAHWKPIMDAAFGGRADMVQALVEAGADPNVIAGGPGRHTPLVRTLQPHKTIPKHAGHEATVATLLALGANANQPAGPLGLAPLGYAAMGGRDDFAAALLAAGAKLDAHLAAMLHDVPALERGIAKSGADCTDDRQRTPLHTLALSGMWKRPGGDARCKACLAALLDAGASVNAIEPIPEGDAVFAGTPLWRAISWQGHATLAQWLLEAGADPDPAVFAACFRGDAQLLDLLHAHGANWNQSWHGRTPLLDLMHFKKPGAAAWLLAHGADVHAADADGRTALHLAAMQGVKASYLEALLEAGANPRRQDNAGLTPLDLARARRRTRAAAFLATLP